MKPINYNFLFADYMDYSIERHGRNLTSPFERLTFDLLCFYPSSIVLTLTSTLIGQSSEKFVTFHDFWKAGKLKIHLSKGDTADKYLDRKLASYNGASTDNYEMNLYLADNTSIFVNHYLKRELIKKGINYVLPRISNADKNNRKAFIDNLGINEREIIEAYDYPMSLKRFDKLALRLENLANDQTFTFQRSHIIHDLVEHQIFPNDLSIPRRLLNMFDASYNQAMAQSINAPILSTMDSQLNGLGLKRFIEGYSPKLYNLICSMVPSQVFLLAQDKNWIIYRNYIKCLFESLLRSNRRVVTQNSDFYKETAKYETKDHLIKACIDKMFEIVFEPISYLNPIDYCNTENLKNLTLDYIRLLKRHFSKEDEYYSEEIIKRTDFIIQICEDIRNEVYT